MNTVLNTTKIAGLTIKSYARLTGFVYFLLIPMGILGIMYIPGLVVDGDSPATIANIMENTVMFKLSMLTAVLTQITHILLVLMLYLLLVSVDQAAAKLLVLLSMLGIPIALLNEMNYGAVLIILGSEELPNSLVNLFLGMHRYGIMIVGVFWGYWLFPMGYLAYKSNFIPKIVGVALMIGCFGYLADSVIFMINPDFGFEFAQYLFVGELMMTFWLLFMGVNEEKWQAWQR